jgi:2-amino-4-hydroxy-6-hydroxymethyldihydropteridine diphosphokinase
MSYSTSSGTTSPVWVYLGLGSNLNNPPAQLQEGLKLIRSEFQLKNLEVSSMVKTPPLGGKDQPDYYNLVCRFNSDTAPAKILESIQKIEDTRGRTREEHWGSRTLDIDILLIGELVFQNDNLTIPHPGLTKRSFVIGPILELDPELVDPKTGLSYQKYWENLSVEDQTSLTKIS